MKYSRAAASLAVSSTTMLISSPTIATATLLSIPISRRTSPSDFQEFNKLFENASIFLPEEYVVNERVAFVDLNMNIRNITCYDISIGGMTVEHGKISSTEFQVTIGMEQLDLTCEMDYDYKYGVLSGDGWVQIKTNENTATSLLKFTSTDFDTEPPNESSVEQCFADVQIKRMDFENDLASEILEVFQGLIRNVVQTAIGNVACDELSTIGVTLVGNMMEVADSNLVPYRGNLGQAVTDPLYLERKLNLPSGLVPLNLQDSEGDVGKVFHQLLHFFDTSLGTTVSDNDLAINVLLRSLFLDEDRAFTVDSSKLPVVDPVLFEGHDRVTQFTITLNKVRVLGLDTLTRFNPFRSIGRRTIQNELTWDSLTAEFDVTIDIKPSTFEDAILRDPTSPGISEQVTIDFTVNKVDVEASFLLVLDEFVLGSMELGPLFYTENFLPCLMSVVHEAQVSGFDVDPSYVRKPSLSGFLSPGLDRVMTNAVEAAFAMYSGVLRDVIPNIFQTTVRDMINSSFLDVYKSKMGTTKCPEAKPIDSQYIDFRAFFDSENAPYGDVPPMLKETLDNDLLAVNNETGRPRINEVILAPLTKMQSGKEGTLKFPADFVSVVLSKSVAPFGLDSFKFRIFDPKVDNVDAVGEPISMLKPNTTDGFLLDNFATLGTNQKKLRVGVTGLFAMAGDPSLTMSNEMDISLELAGSEAWASLMAKVDTAALYGFPLRDITKIHCWLNTLLIPDALNEDKDTGVSLRSLLLSTASLDFNVSCIDCTSRGLTIVPEVVDSLREYGVSDVLERRVVDLGLDFLRSDFTQRYINSILMDASVRCPHSSSYVGPDISFNTSSLTLPALPHESLETIAFASILLLEIGAVAVAEEHKLYNLNETQPLSGQSKIINTDSNVRLVDFTSLEVPLGEWKSLRLADIGNYLNAEVPDPSESSGSDMRINSMLRSSLVSDAGYMSLAVEDLGLSGMGMDISFKEIRIGGLDTISTFDVLNAVAPQTLSNGISWKRIDIQLVVSLMSSNSNDRLLKERRDITVKFELADVNLSLSMLMAMDLDRLGSLQLSSMLEVRKMLSCFLTAAYAAQITEFDVTVGSISALSVEGFQSSEIQSASTKSSQMILEKYGVLLKDQIPKVFDSTIRTLFNNWMSYNMKESNVGKCNSLTSAESPTNFVDLRDLLWNAADALQLGGAGLTRYGDLFSMAAGFVRDIFKADESTGLSGLNEAVVIPFTLSNFQEPGTIHKAGDLFSGGTQVKVGERLDANVYFRAYEAKIENLDTVGNPLQLLGGVMEEAYQLNNTMTIGVGQRPLRFSSKFLVSVDGEDDFQINNEVDLSIELSNANVIIQTMAKIAEGRFFGFPLRDILNLNCWLATIPAPELDPRGVRTMSSEATASLSGLEAHIGQLIMRAECTNCSSPRMSELITMLSDPQAQEETTEVANTLLDYITQLLGGNFLQTQLDRLLTDAARRCPHNPLFEDLDAAPLSYEAFEAPDSGYGTSYLILLGGLALASLVIFSIIVFTVRAIVRRRHSRWLQKLPPYQIKRLAHQQKQESTREDQLNSATTSMFKSQYVPCTVQWLVPIVILGNIVFFLSGHLSLGATVNITAEVAGEKFTIDNFFEFSIARSTIDIWNAGGQGLAILILIFSGIWPYTKLLMTLAIWFMSPSRLSVSKRGSVLLWLDWLAKWSMIDVFTLVICIAAFRVSIESPDTSYLPEDFYSVEMMVIPLWGLYANMIAQLISQLTSHVIINYHRRIITMASLEKSQAISAGLSGPSTSISIPVQTSQMQVYRADLEKADIIQSVSLASIPMETNEPKIGEDTELKESLRKHHFSRPHRGETEKLVARNYVDKVLFLFAISLIILVIVGCSLPSFSVELFGLVGLAVEFGQEFQTEATVHHSVFSVVKLLFDQANYLGTARDYVGLIFLSILFISTLLFIPIIQSIGLLMQWYRTTTVTQKQKTAVRLEILQAWQYLDVYLVALFVTSWQLGPISSSMINKYCQNLETMFAHMVHYGVLKEEDAQCFTVTSHIENGAFALALGATLLAFLSTFVFKASVQYLHDAKDRQWQMKAEEDGTSVSFSDETSHVGSDQDEGAPDNGFAGTIHRFPVLFTDSFRWMLKADNSIPSSSRALFGNVNTEESHWSLPEAIAVVDEFPIGLPKGTIVSDLEPSNGKMGAREPARLSSTSSLSKGSSYSSCSPGKGKRLTYDEDEIYSYKSSPKSDWSRPEQAFKSDQRSIPSQMDSVSTSFKDEASMISEAESLVYSLPSSMGKSVPPPPPPLESRQSPTTSAAASRKAPPPSAYRLSTSSLKKPPPSSTSASPFASYFAQGKETDQSTMGDNRSKKRTPEYVSEDDEDFTQVSFEDTLGNDDFEEQTVQSKSDRSGREFI